MKLRSRAKYARIGGTRSGGTMQVLSPVLAPALILAVFLGAVLGMVIGPKLSAAATPRSTTTEQAAAPDQDSAAEPSRLCVVWSSGDPEVAWNLVFMYVFNAKKQGWFDEVNLVVWGASAGLLRDDPEMQAEIQAMQEVGVVTEACIVCARRYDAVETFESIGIDVKGMGEPLSNRLKAGWQVITF